MKRGDRSETILAWEEVRPSLGERRKERPGTDQAIRRSRQAEDLTQARQAGCRESWRRAEFGQRVQRRSRNQRFQEPPRTRARSSQANRLLGQQA